MAQKRSKVNNGNNLNIHHYRKRPINGHVYLSECCTVVKTNELGL